MLLFLQSPSIFSTTCAYLNLQHMALKSQFSTVDGVLFNLNSHCSTPFSLSNEKDVHLIGPHCPICLLKVNDIYCQYSWWLLFIQSLRPTWQLRKWQQMLPQNLISSCWLTISFPHSQCTPVQAVPCYIQPLSIWTDDKPDNMELSNCPVLRLQLHCLRHYNVPMFCSLCLHSLL